MYSPQISSSTGSGSGMVTYAIVATSGTRNPRKYVPTVISTMTYRPVIDAEPSEEMLDASSSTFDLSPSTATRQLGLVDDPEKHAVLEERRVGRVAADLPVVLIAEQRTAARLQLDLQAVELGLVGVVAHGLVGAVEEVDARIAASEGRKGTYKCSKTIDSGSLEASTMEERSSILMSVSHCVWFSVLVIFCVPACASCAVRGREKGKVRWGDRGRT